MMQRDKCTSSERRSFNYKHFIVQTSQFRRCTRENVCIKDFCSDEHDFALIMYKIDFIPKFSSKLDALCSHFH